jgi:CBS domain containing-hemolysin-like protein
LAFITITVLHIVLGELAPKNMAIQQAERVSLIIALPLRIFYLVFKPFIWLLNATANAFVNLIGFKPVNEEETVHTPEELRYLLEESTKSGVIGLSEHELLENVFEFSDTPIKQIMVPRGKISAIEASLSVEEVIEKFVEQGYSRMPIYEKSIDNIIGVIYAKDLIKVIMRGEKITLLDIIHPAFIVSEEEKINKLLYQFQKQKIHIAIVIDEFGGTAGLVTIEDVIEEIVGEIQDEYDEESPLIEKINEREFVVKASTPINDANDHLPVALPESDDYETVGGLVISLLGRIPEMYELINLENYSCKILKRSKRYVELIRLTLKNDITLEK